MNRQIYKDFRVHTYNNRFYLYLLCVLQKMLCAMPMPTSQIHTLNFEWISVLAEKDDGEENEEDASFRGKYVKYRILEIVFENKNNF